MARRKNGSTKAPSLQKMAIYFFAFAVPPVILGTLLAFRSITELMIRKAPDQALIAESTKLAGPSPKFTSHKPRAVILMSSAGTEISDLLGAYDVLSESGALEVVTAAPERRLSPTTSDLAVVPDFALADAPQADLLVLPAIQDPGNLAILDWVRKQAAGARVILSLGEGARMLAQAGLLENHRVTTHVLALANLRQLVPQAKWEDSSRVVRDQRLISSAGMSATPEAALAALEQIAGSAVAHKTAQALGIVPLLGRPATGVGARDAIKLFLYGGYAWSKKDLAIEVYSGVDELGLASALDSFGRTLLLHTGSIGAERKLVTSRHGMKILPGRSLPDYSYADAVLLPPGKSGSAPRDEKLLHQWIGDLNPRVIDQVSQTPGQALTEDLRVASSLEGRGSAPLIRFAAKLLEVPESAIGALPAESQEIPWMIFLRPILVGILGLFVARIFVRRLSNSQGR